MFEKASPNRLIGSKVKVKKGAAVDQKVAELESALGKASVEDSDAEKQFEILKRKSIRENEEAKWSAIRDVGS